MNTPRVATIEVFADYHQFYVQDGGLFPDAPTDWTDEDIQNRVKVAESVVVVCPIRNTAVPVEIELQLGEPSVSLGKFDHVATCTLKLPTGILQVHECTGGEVLRWSVAPGNYSVMVLFSGLDTLSQNGLEGNDHYRIVLWPGNEAPLRVLRAWLPKANPS